MAFHKPVNLNIMRLEFVRVEEANDLVNQIIEHHPHAIFLSDNNLKIKFFNHSFQKLCKCDKRDIIDHDFCAVIGCKECNKIDDNAEQHAKKCHMHELMSGSNLSEFALIRDFEINNETVTKHLHIDTHKVVMNEKKYRLVIIDDRTGDKIK